MWRLLIVAGLFLLGSSIAQPDDLRRDPFLPPVAARAMGPTAVVLATVDETARDGDTFRAHVDLWGGWRWVGRVRLAGIDAPEIGTEARCPAEAAAAEQARQRLAAAVPVGARVYLSAPATDKFQGRIDATVYTGSGENVNTAMIASGLVRAWNGRGARGSWCAPQGGK